MSEHGIITLFIIHSMSCAVLFGMEHDAAKIGAVRHLILCTQDPSTGGVDERFKVERSLACKCRTIRNVVEDLEGFGDLANNVTDRVMDLELPNICARQWRRLRALLPLVDDSLVYNIRRLPNRLMQELASLNIQELAQVITDADFLDVPQLVYAGSVCAIETLHQQDFLRNPALLDPYKLHHASKRYRELFNYSVYKPFICNWIRYSPCAQLAAKRLVTALTFNQDSTGITAATIDGAVHIWDRLTGKRHSRTWWLLHDSSALSPDGNQIAFTAIQFPFIEIRNINTYDVTVIEDQGLGNSIVAWNTQSTQIIVGAGRLVKTFDAHTGGNLFVKEFEGEADITSLAWNAHGQLCVGFTNGQACISGPNSAEPFVTLDEHERKVLCVAWSSDCRFVATGGEDTSVRIWNAATGQTVAHLQGHHAPIYAVAWSPDGTRIVTGADDGDLKVWDVEAGELLATLYCSGNVSGIVWSFDGTKIAASFFDGSIRVWNAVVDDQTHAQFENLSVEQGLFLLELYRRYENGDTVIVRICKQCQPHVVRTYKSLCPAIKKFIKPKINFAQCSRHRHSCEVQ